MPEHFFFVISDRTMPFVDSLPSKHGAVASRIRSILNKIQYDHHNFLSSSIKTQKDICERVGTLFPVCVCVFPPYYLEKLHLKHSVVNIVNMI